MILSSVIVASNLLFLMLFLRLWAPDWRGPALNVYLAPLSRLTDRVVLFLRPAFFFLPDALIVLVSLLLLVAFRGVLFYNAPYGWRLTAGATLMIREIETHSPVSCLMFSFLSLIQFLVRVWFLAWLVEWVNGGRSRGPAAEALHWASFPVSVLPFRRRPVAMLLVNALFVLLLSGAGAPLEEVIIRGEPQSLPGIELAWAASPVRSAVRLALLSLGGTLDGMMLGHNLMVLLIVVGLIGLLSGNAGLQARSGEWIQLLLGRFGRRPLLVGNWDLTPLIYLLLLPIFYALLLQPVGMLASVL